MTDAPTPESPPERCVSCHAKLKGAFCHKCGERTVRERDFELGKIFQDVFNGLTHLDAKHFQTLKLLFTRPGALTVAYVKGRRKAYLKPIQVFFWCNVLAFLFVGGFDIFLVPSKWFFADKYEGFSVMPLVEKVAARKHLTVAQVALLYDEKVKNWSKLLVIAMTPVLALASYVGGWRRAPAFGMHFVHALHVHAFVLVWSLIWIELAIWLPFQLPKAPYLVSGFLLLGAYMALSLRRFLRYGWAWAVVHATGMLLSLLLVWYFYRFWVSLFTLYCL